MALSKHARSPHSPSPIYGIRPGFTIADIEGRYMRPLRIYGTFDSGTDQLTASASTSDASGTTIKPHCNVIKVNINVTSGSGSVQVIMKSAVDNFTATIADFGALGVGTYEFFIGGWSSPDSDGTNYTATKYGPVKPGSSPASTNPTGNEETTNPDPNADSNYMGGGYNPFQFLSLDGYDLKFFSTVVGTIAFDATAIAVS